jgi:hypothetical protein
MPQGERKGVFLPNEKQAMDVVWAAKAARDLEMSIAEQVTLSAIRNIPCTIFPEMPCAVTLADPSMPDCPLIGCSHTFETMTGYPWGEIIGQNCRFLNKGVNLEPAARTKLREAVQYGHEFVGILPNVRKNGERFKNFLNLTTMEVRGKKYLIGIQADVTNVDVNPDNPGHVRAMRDIAETIFSNNLDAWVQMQAREFSIRLPAPYSQLLKLCDPADFERERQKFVRLGSSGAVVQQYGEANSEKSNRTASAPLAKKDSAAVKKNKGKPAKTVGETSEAPSPSQAPSEKSAGSAMHPNGCTECHFFMFNPGGCRAGKDCIFCHELHPRRNAKKNRRFIKKLVDIGDVGVIDELKKLGSLPAADIEAFTNRRKVGAMMQDQAEVDDELGWARQTTNDSIAVSQISHASTNSSGVDFITLLYSKDDSSAVDAASFTLAAGVGIHLPAMVCTDKTSLESLIEFSAEPSLPDGLVLDARSGLISGMPLKA